VRRIPQVGNLVDAEAVTVDELLPECSPGAHRLLPADVVEEQEELVGDRAPAGETVAHRRGVLRDGVAARGGAVEPEPLAVGARW
jgi:hypothetical protein